MFARSTPTELMEACFRDDVPYISNKCDTTCCGSEYLTMREILAGVAPAHLVSLPEYPKEVVAPLHGKYTWDGLFNTVVFSPHWSSMSFQLIDHFFYNAFGRIPSYAHVMTKRYICDPPVNVNEGPLSKGCYEKAPCGAKTKRFDFGEPTPEGQTDQFMNYKYYDFADHYAIECCLVLDDSDDTIKKITDATTKPMNKLTDKFMKLVIGTSLSSLTNWRVLLGFRLLPDNLPKKYSDTRLLAEDKKLYQRAIFYPRRWFFSLETPSYLHIPRYLRSAKNNILDRRFRFLDNKLVQTEQYLKITTGNVHLRIKNSEDFEWASYLPPITSISTDLVEFQQFVVKAFNRMLERETINRSWQLPEGWEKYTKEVYMDLDLESPDCKKTQSKTLHKCVTFKMKPQFNNIKKKETKRNKELNLQRKTRRKILRALNMQEVNTLQNAKQYISKNKGKTKHSKRVEIPELTLESIRPGSALYEGATETVYTEPRPLTQTIGNTMRGATGAVSTATDILANTARRLGSYVRPSPTATTTVVQEQIPTPASYVRPSPPAPTKEETSYNYSYRDVPTPW
jgi:hypothetical protein